MPVLIHASVEDLDIVRPLAARLRADGGEVRCYLDDDDYELRNLGCKLAVGQLDDEANLEGALTNVHTLMTLLPDPARVKDESELEELGAVARAASSAASTADIDQVIAVASGVSRSDSRLGRSLRECEDGFRSLSTPTCLLRVGLVWGTDRPFTRLICDLTGEEATRLGDIRLSVLEVDVLVALLTKIDDREAVSGEWDAGGKPRTVSELRLLCQAPHSPASAGPLSPLWREVLGSDLLLPSTAEQEFPSDPGAVDSVSS